MYVMRNTEREIVALSHVKTEMCCEAIAQDDIELQQFLTSIKTSQQTLLENTDLAMARVLEDVVNLLVGQGTIRFTDLPEAAQVKLLSRKELRNGALGAYQLSDDDGLHL
jgi:hypothetical protein